MAILQFSKHGSYGSIQLESACKYAREIGSCTYATVKKALKKGAVATDEPKATPSHENIRGSAYYN
jgi:hypothetical protein